MKLWLIAPALITIAQMAPNASAAGAYETDRASDSQACANLCAADGLCMAWTYTDADSSEGACSFSAVAPTSEPPPGAITGLSPRAPDFARTQFAARTAAVEKDKTHAAANADIGDDSELLGGRDGADDLRSRLAFDTNPHRRSRR